MPPRRSGLAPWGNSAKSDFFGGPFDILAPMPPGTSLAGQNEIELRGERPEPVDEPLGFLGAQAIVPDEILCRICRLPVSRTSRLGGLGIGLHRGGRRGRPCWGLHGG